MDSQRQQAAERIKQATNILVTVSNNPSVDQLAACMGITLALNKMNKHATAVFSGQVPSTLEFLQPEKTIEKNTDSLRDFIIALDKSKADKLRYKVEDRVVKIFITPYRTSISDKDLEFSQGDFNVDVVLTLGVHTQAELDQAITAHGRILHDATIITINTRPGGELGSINWLDPGASSLSELATELVASLDRSMIDGQIATAFLTGIVSETERFSNAKTSPQTMSVSAELMGAGANQQLVASKLEEPAELPPRPIAQVSGGAQEAMLPAPKKTNDGTLEIAHEEKMPSADTSDAFKQETSEKPVMPRQSSDNNDLTSPVAPPLSPAPTLPEPEPQPAFEASEKPKPPQVRIDDQGALAPAPISDNADADLDHLEDILPPAKHEKPTISRHNEAPKMVVMPPPMQQGGNIASDETEEGPGLPGLPAEESPQLLNGRSDHAPSDEAQSPQDGGIPIIQPDDQNAPGTSFLGDQPVVTKEKPLLADEENGKTLTDIERDVHSSHLSQTPVPPVFSGGLPPVSPAPLMPPAPPQAASSAGTTLPPLPGMESSVPAFTNSTMPAPGSLPPPGNDFGPSLTPPGVQQNEPVQESTPGPITDANSPEAEAAAASADLDSARDAVMQALKSGGDDQLDPVASLNAQPLGSPQTAQDAGAATPPTQDPLLGQSQEPVQPWTPSPAAAPELDEVQQAFLQPSSASAGQSTQGSPGAPPPVPPPMMPPAV